jgi:hypothetical protein
MYRLFGDEAVRRRTQMATALQAAAPSRARALRGTFEPLASADRPTPTEPFVVPAPADSLAALDVLRTRGRSPMLTVLAVALALGAGAIGAVGALRRSSITEEQPAVVAPPTPVVASERATAAEPAPSVAVTASPAPPSVGTAPKTTGAAHATPPAKQAAPVRPHVPAAKTKFDVAKLPEVDPTPF